MCEMEGNANGKSVWPSFIAIPPLPIVRIVFSSGRLSGGSIFTTWSKDLLLVYNVQYNGEKLFHEVLLLI